MALHVIILVIAIRSVKIETFFIRKDYLLPAGETSFFPGLAKLLSLLNVDPFELGNPFGFDELEFFSSSKIDA